MCKLNVANDLARFTTTTFFGHYDSKCRTRPHSGTGNYSLKKRHDMTTMPFPCENQWHVLFLTKEELYNQ
jgi:hypothetical protein